MMYEEPKDVLNERFLMQAWCKEHLGIPSFKKWKYDTSWDDGGLLLGGELVARFEVKVASSRRKEKSIELGFPIDVEKVRPATFLIVGWEDGEIWATQFRQGYETRWGGRTDRNDPNDYSEFAKIPSPEFHKFHSRWWK